MKKENIPLFAIAVVLIFIVTALSTVGNRETAWYKEFEKLEPKVVMSRLKNDEGTKAKNRKGNKKTKYYRKTI